MKQLTPITIGGYTINVTIKPERNDNASILFTATCNGMTAKSRLDPQGKADHSEDQFQKDIQERANLLAEELAGKLRAKDLRDKIFSS